MKCPICNGEINEKAAFCKNCGNPIPRCPSCAAILTKPTRFCTKDGTPIPAETLALFQKKEQAEQK